MAFFFLGSGHMEKYFPVFACQYEQLLSDYERLRQSFEEQKDANQP